MIICDTIYQTLLFCIFKMLLKSLTTDTWWLNPKFFAAQIQISTPNKYLGFGYKGLVVCRNNGWLMENMDKGLAVPKWVLINRPKIPQIPQNISAQFVCLSPKFWDFDEKRLHRASVVRALPLFRRGSIRHSFTILALLVQRGSLITKVKAVQIKVATSIRIVIREFNSVTI